MHDRARKLLDQRKAERNTLGPQDSNHTEEDQRGTGTYPLGKKEANESLFASKYEWHYTSPFILKEARISQRNWEQARLWNATESHRIEP